jgi:hypothetical protein
MDLNNTLMELKLARPEDRLKAIEAYKEGLLTIEWGDKEKSPRQWAKEKGWPTPLFGFKKAFIRKMLENDENFTDALILYRVNVWIPDY